MVWPDISFISIFYMQLILVTVYASDLYPSRKVCDGVYSIQIINLVTGNTDCKYHTLSDLIWTLSDLIWTDLIWTLEPSQAMPAHI